MDQKGSFLALLYTFSFFQYSPWFTFVYGSSCNFLFFTSMLLFCNAFHRQPQCWIGCQEINTVAVKKKELKQNREHCMNCRTQKLWNPGLQHQSYQILGCRMLFRNPSIGWGKNNCLNVIHPSVLIIWVHFAKHESYNFAKFC